MAADAGIDTERDPVAATGDLKSDIEGFTTLEACVRAHVSHDTLLGDALDALGYDTFTRDACRTVQALKARSAETCRPIAFAALRSRCEAQVATLLGEPRLCPSSAIGAGSSTRDPTCLARSMRDPRLCLAAAESDRAACRALVTGDPAPCGTDRVCARQAARWRSVLTPPIVKGSDLATAGSAEVARDDQPPVHVDFAALAQAGALLKISGERVRLIIGRAKTSIWAQPQDAWAIPQLFIDLTLPRSALTPSPQSARQAGPHAAEAFKPVELGIGDLSFEMLVPKLAELSGATATKRQLTAIQLTPSMGAPASLDLLLELTQAPHRYRVKIHLETFVRETSGPGMRPTGEEPLP
jgi:hypothetical protein